MNNARYDDIIPNMNYERYYSIGRSELFSLKDQMYAYQDVISILHTEQPQTVDVKKPLTFLLGGFHPVGTTPDDFLDFCYEFHPNEKDRHILLDMNTLPLGHLSPDKFPNRVQGRLESLPFQNSIDVIILDFTLDFMADNQVKNFANSASSALTENGIVIATTENVALPVFNNFFRKRTSWGSHHTRSIDDLERLINPELNINVHIEYEDKNTGNNFNIVALKR